MDDGSTDRLSSKKESGTTIPPEILEQVAAKVYALWLKELQIEHERRRLPSGRLRSR